MRVTGVCYRLCPGHHIENRSPNRNRNAVLARLLEAGICRAGADGWNTVFDCHAVLVVLWISIARVPNENAFWDEVALELFVLCTRSDAAREFELR